MECTEVGCELQGKCKNYEPEEPTWTKCFFMAEVTYSNDGEAGRDCASYPRLKWFVKGTYAKCQGITRAGFQTQEDAKLFLAALPEEER